MIRALKSLAYLIVLPALLLAAWWITSTLNPSFFFPPLPDILAEFPVTWDFARISAHVFPSLGRLAIAYFAAVVIGVLLGILLGLSRIARGLTEAILEFMRATPPTAMVPVIMLFLGIGDTMRVVVIIVGCVWPILLNTIEGVRGIDEVLSDTARTYRYRKTGRLFHLVLPGASPQIFTGARQALAIAIIMMVISEMFAASNGIGFQIVQFQHQYSIPEMWSGVILLGVLGFALSRIFILVERRALAWYQGFKANTDLGG